MSLEKLTQDTLILARHLPMNVDAVVGIARSGVYPAALLAMHLHLPLFTVTRHTGVLFPGHGSRLEPPDSLKVKHVALIDDTVALGREMTACLPPVRDFFPNAEVTTAVVYAHPDGRHAVDQCVSIYPGQHYLEWNWHNAGHGKQCAYDFDGILCDDCPIGDDDDGPRYLRFLTNAKWLFLPRRQTIPMIVTGRHEKYRTVTLDWLHRHKLSVDTLIMRPFEVDPDVPFNIQIGRWKAEHYRNSRCALFAESDPEQAELINQITGRPVICPIAERVFPPDPRPAIIRENPQRLSRVLACPHRQRASCHCAAACTFPWNRKIVTLSDCFHCGGM